MSAEINEVFSPSAFTLEEPDDGWGWDWDWDPGAEGVLVLSAPNQSLSEDQVVQVTGTVRSFSYNQYTNDYGLGDIVLYEGYENEPAIVASQVNTDVPNEGNNQNENQDQTDQNQDSQNQNNNGGSGGTDSGDMNGGS